MTEKQAVTIIFILIAECGYIFAGLSVLADIADVSVSYDWITTRLILVVIGMITSPIIISHSIEWIDLYLKEENE